MRNRIYINGGYVGLLALLVSFAIIVFAVWKFGPSMTSGGNNKSNIEQDLQAVEQARLLKEALEQRNRQILGQ